jgi:hypothetical protein
MAPNLLEIITLGLLAFIVLYGALQLLWAFWDGRKSDVGSRTE